MYHVQTGASVKYRLLTGLAAGAACAFHAAVHSHFLPTIAWGAWPLLLGIIPFAAGLLCGRPLLLGALPEVPRRFAPLVLALMLPPALYLLYGATDAFAFIGGGVGPLPLIFSTLLYAVAAGLPIDALTAAESSMRGEQNAATGDRLAWLLLGAGFGYLAVSVLTGSFGLPALWIAQFVFFLPLVIPFPAEQDADEDALRKQERRLRLPSPWNIVRIVFPVLLLFVLPFVLQAMAEIPAFSESLQERMPAAILIALGLGWQAGLLTARKGYGLAVGIVSLIFAAALLLNLAGTWLTDWFPAVYESYYLGGDSGFEAQMFALHLLTALFFCAAGLAHVRIPQSAPLPAGIVLLQLAAGLLLALFLRDTVYFTWILMGAGVLVALLSLYLLLRMAERNAATAILAVLWLAHLALLADIGSPGFRNFFNPAAFRVVAEERTPAGRMTLLQSRDYDDRFHTVFWNQQRALTQASRAVQSDLQRMGHIPMLMAPAHPRVLMLGLGSSRALEAVAMHEPASVICVEPSAAMLRLSKATQETARPRPWLRGVQFHHERIEAYLSRSDAKADVIISAEPFAEPGMEPALLTRRWFALIAEHLTSDGIFAQWLPVAHLDLNAMRPVFTAALEVFPHTEFWITSPDPENAMVGIIASAKPFAADQPSGAQLKRLRAASTGLRDHFLRIELGSFASLISAYGGDRAALEALAKDVTPYGLFDGIPRRPGSDLQQTMMDVHALLSARSAPARLLREADDSTRVLASTLLQQRPLIMRAKISALAGDDTTAVRMLTEIVEQTPDNEEAARVLGDILLRQAAGYVGAEQFGPALQLITRSLTLMPVNTYLLRLLMIAAFNVGDREASGLAIDGIRRLDPAHAGFRDNQATIRARQGATDDALLLYENAITLDPTNEEFYTNMASFHYSQGRIWEAIRVLDQATQRAYYKAKPYYLKGMFYAEQGRLTLAKESYEQYLRVASPLDPYRTEVPGRIEELEKFQEQQR